ncbi:MAG TPA: heliorhodopsin HeR [Gaiellaceae bacterium]|nr:heliorhodopsin HeR [Gaiellaceae bacterium]
MPRLRAANLALAVIHGGQAILVVVLGAALAIPITAQWADGPPGTALKSPETLFDLPVRWCVAAFLLMAAVDHLLVASPGIVSWYERNLGRGINYARWIEYSFSASLMVVLIATFAGVTDLRALIAVAGANAAMILFGLLMERSNLGREPLDWLPFWLGCLVGAVPWIVIGVSLVGAEVDGSVPGFVWGIFVSLFLFFNSFALNMWLQYRGIGPWRSYVFGEWGYVVLSLTAKSALAWQIYAGALAG